MEGEVEGVGEGGGERGGVLMINKIGSRQPAQMCENM